MNIPEKLVLWDYSIAVTLTDGRIFISGGINAELKNIQKCATILIPKSDTFIVEECENMKHGRYTHTSTILNEFVYVLGGRYFGCVRIFLSLNHKRVRAGSCSIVRDITWKPRGGRTCHPSTQDAAPRLRPPTRTTFTLSEGTKARAVANPSRGSTSAENAGTSSRLCCCIR